MGKSKKIFLGQKYGNRLVTGNAGKDSRGRSLYNFKCDCGHEGVATGKIILRNPLHCDNCKWNKIFN